MPYILDIYTFICLIIWLCLNIWPGHAFIWAVLFFLSLHVLGFSVIFKGFKNVYPFISVVPKVGKTPSLRALGRSCRTKREMFLSTLSLGDKGAAAKKILRTTALYQGYIENSKLWLETNIYDMRDRDERRWLSLTSLNLSNCVTCSQPVHVFIWLDLVVPMWLYVCMVVCLHMYVYFDPFSGSLSTFFICHVFIHCPANRQSFIFLISCFLCPWIFEWSERVYMAVKKKRI